MPSLRMVRSFRNNRHFIPEFDFGHITFYYVPFNIIIYQFLGYIGYVFGQHNLTVFFFINWLNLLENTNVVAREHFVTIDKDLSMSVWCIIICECLALPCKSYFADLLSF